MVELAKWQDQKVVVTYNLDEPNADGHTAEEVEGVVTAANEGIALVIKPTGKTMMKLIKAKNIEQIIAAPSTLRIFKQKEIRPAGLDTVRQHLLDRHGVQLSWINGVDEAKALAFHEDLDHSNLGHAHAETSEE